MARPARIFLAAELLLGVTCFLLPDSLLRAAVYCSLGLGMVVAVVVGTRLYRPNQPLAWYLPAAGQFSFTAGDAINYTYQWVLEVELELGRRERLGRALLDALTDPTSVLDTRGRIVAANQAWVRFAAKDLAEVGQSYPAACEAAAAAGYDGLEPPAWGVRAVLGGEVSLFGCRYQAPGGAGPARSP